jgi:flavin reductase (DIM6/NTAB) family NADH-FMN oxidoreductase RutF
MYDYLELAKKAIEETSVETWDATWASELCIAALDRVNASYKQLSEEKRATVDFLSEDQWIDRMDTAAKANDPTAFRTAVKGWERVLLEAVEEARTRL